MNQFFEEKYQSKDIKINFKKKKNLHSKNKIRIAILGGSTTDLIKKTLFKYLAINNIYSKIIYSISNFRLSPITTFYKISIFINFKFAFIKLNFMRVSFIIS